MSAVPVFIPPVSIPRLAIPPVAILRLSPFHRLTTSWTGTGERYDQPRLPFAGSSPIEELPSFSSW